MTIKIIISGILILLATSLQIFAQENNSIYYKYYNPTPLSLNQAISGITIPPDIKERIVLLDIEYLGFDNQIHTGQMLVDSKLSEEIELIFEELLAIGFKIEKIIPVSRYNWSDNLSMEDNNTSCFNYRTVEGSSRLSLHAYGRAIDINPRLNPYISNGTPSPSNARYEPGKAGTIEADSKIVEIFYKYNWRWGGDWVYSKDYQHFYKDR